MKTDDNRDKLRLIKHFFIFNMLQQPSCFIIKPDKKSSTNIKQENIYPNNLSTEKSSNDKISTEFIPLTQQVISENDSGSTIPICDKLTMAKFLVIIKLLQRPYHNENMNKASKNNPININNENKATPNKLSLFKNLKNKSDAKFMLFIRQVTFKNNSQSIKKKGKINTADDIYEISENENADYLESLIPPPPIIIEEKDIDIDIPIE